MWQMIFDNDYQPDRNYVRPVPGEMSRWNPPQWEFDPRGRWSSADKFGRVLQHEGSRDNLTFSGGRNLFKPNYGYNVPGDGAREIFPENNICTDLKLAMLLLPQAEQARLTLSLTSFDNVFIGEISADGWCKLTVRKEAPLRTTDRSAIVELHKKLPPLGVGHAHRVALTHADLEVTLWVDDQPVIRSEYGMDYQQLVELVRSPNMVPEPRVAISAEGKLQLRHIQLLRDVYYTNPTVDDVSAGPYGEVARVDEVAGGSTPGWGTLGHPIELVDASRRPERAGGLEPQDLPDLDEFLVLGDNSPSSLDSRMWTKAAPTLMLWKNPNAEHDQSNQLYKLGTVPRYSLKGKAMFVYWPAGYQIQLPGGIGFHLPIVPNVGRMRLIR